MHKQSLSGTWKFRQVGNEEWINGQVPGDVHTALMAAGIIPNPFVADHEKKVQWVAEKDWEYWTVFNPAPSLLAEESIFLACDGLDTLADVYLNGQFVGHAENEFRSYSWEVKKLLRKGENEIRVLFGSPAGYIRERQKVNRMFGGGDIPGGGGPHLRKAPSQWGWDWGPILPPIGIWKDIRLEGYSAARLIDVHLRQQHHGKNITVSTSLKCERFNKKAELKAALKITSPDDKTQVVEGALSSEKRTITLAIPVEQPQLWWPNGYGKQPLYHVEVILSQGEKVCDQREYRIGLRTIELRREPDEWGESFIFVVNGVPVFAKGADWIPADSFPTRISDAYLEHLIRSAADTYMNMLRVWGGGFYEEERFYDLCDRYGIMVWQDFTFACGVYPIDQAFFENVRIEAIQNVRRLRHRTCLALWCGNNEMEQGWSDWGWNRPNDATNQALKEGYDRMFHHLLPGVVATQDPDRPYWPSSASSGIPFAQPNSQLRGDTHYWDVWHGRKPFTAYRDQYPRFMSEFGFQALPPLKTIKTYAAEKDWNMTSYVMEHHQRSGSGNGLMIGQMTDTFRMPKDFASLVYLSMVLQAEGIRYGVEHWRRSRNRVGGTLYWQLNDCWPVASWASLDYFGRWKALHYAAKRFYAPVLLSVEDSGTKMNVHVTSDLMDSWQGEVRWRLETLEGGVIDRGEQMVQAAPLANTPVCALDFGDRISDDNCRQVIFICELWHDRLKLAWQVATFAPNKHLELADPELATKVRLGGVGKLAVDITAKRLARFIELELEGVDAVFSDNYFDLPAHCATRITCALPEGWTMDQAQKALRVRSLVDSY